MHKHISTAAIWLWHVGRGLLTAAMAGVLIASPALGDDGGEHRWINASGGMFENAANWDLGEPGPTDIALFDLDATYIVDFNTDPTNERLHVADGFVTLDLAGEIYTLTGTGTGNIASVRVGGPMATPATLRVLSGTLQSVRGFVRHGGAIVSGFSSWINSGSMAVWGTLDIADGGFVQNDTGTITSAGLVTVDNGTWINTGDLRVAYEGFGAMVIDNGGRVESANGLIASNSLPGSTTDVTVTVRGDDGNGTASAWINSGALRVGHTGRATLTIQDGAAVQNTIGYVGSHGQADGRVHVHGAGSSWTNSDALYVGWAGAGRMTIEDGGQVSSTAGYVGFTDDSFADRMGEVIVRGAGSSWNNAGELYVGHEYDAAMTIEAGGQVTSTDSVIGRSTDTVASVTVADAGSTWTSQELLVGRAGGHGELTLISGGAVSSTDGQLGASLGSTGVARIAGGGSIWSLSGDLVVGNFAEGTLLIEAAGRVENVNAYLGRSTTGSHNPPSTGSVTVTGTGSVWHSTGSVVLGGDETDAAGHATLNVQAGGTVIVDDTLTIWDHGTVRLDGGTLTTNAIDFAGSTFLFTSGALNVTGSQAVDHAMLQKLLGAQPTVRTGQSVSLGGTTTLTQPLTIDGGAFTARFLNVGPTGVLDIAHGEVNIDAGLLYGSGVKTYSLDSDTLATLRLTNGAEFYAPGHQLTIADTGRAVLEMPNGVANAAASVLVGNAPGSHGTVHLSGTTGHLHASDQITIGVAGRGELNLSNNAELGSDMVVLGASAGGAGSLHARGAGSSITATDLVVGDAGDGRLHLADGVDVTTDSLRLGASAGGHGLVTLDDTAITVAELAIGSSVGGTGRLEIHDNATLTSAAGGSFDVRAGSRLVLDGGTLILQGDDARVRAGGRLDFHAGTLNVNVPGSGLVFSDSDLVIPTAGTLNLGARIAFSGANGLVSLPGSTINVTSNDASLGSLSYVAAVNLQGSLHVNAFDLALNSAGSVPLGPLTTIAGGSITNLNTSGGVTLPAGHVLTGHGAIDTRVAAATGSQIHVSGGHLSLGDPNAFNGFTADSWINLPSNTSATLHDASQARLGALTTIGENATLTASNGVLLDFARAIRDMGTIDTPDDPLRPTIINGHVEGFSLGSPITFDGYVKGVGTFDNVAFNGTHAPGLSPTIAHVGNVIYSPDATLEIEIGGLTAGSAFDQINSTGILLLDGTLAIDLIHGFSPAAGDTFELLIADTIFGTFDEVAFDLPGLSWSLDHLEQSIVLAISHLLGDMNFDGAVDTADVAPFVQALANPSGYTAQYQVDEATMIAAGDINGDGAFDTADVAPFVQLLVGAGSSSVPEPSTLTLLAMGGLTLLRRCAARGG